MTTHPEIFLGSDRHDDFESNLFFRGKIKQFNETFRMHPGIETTINGFKSPEILTMRQCIHNIEEHFPEIDLIVSTRHPISFFESLYNYKFRREKYKGEPTDPLNLIGNCCYQCKRNCIDLRTSKCTCTSKALFHYALSRIMLTPMNTTEELDLLDYNDWSKHPKFQGRVFLTEIGQFTDRNETRKGQWNKYLENFLGLTPDSFVWEKVAKNTSRDKLIQICDDKYKPIRDELIAIGKKSSKWILEYFMKSPRVVIPNQEHFVELVTAWQYDYCMS